MSPLTHDPEHFYLEDEPPADGPGPAWCGPVPAEGMTLRDWFAGQALNGILANPNTYNGAAVLREHMPTVAYAIADAMLAARAARTGEAA